MWYTEYPRLIEKLLTQKANFEARCQELGKSPNKILLEFRPAFLTKAVHESNWQEGLKLEEGKTQCFSEKAMADLEKNLGPAIDLNKVLKSHQESVKGLFASGATVEEVGAYNLSVAHTGILIVSNELLNRQLAAFCQTMRNLIEGGTLKGERLNRLKTSLAKFTNDAKPAVKLLPSNIRTRGELMTALLELDEKDLGQPMKCMHVQFLHRLTMMGMLEPQKCGAFRKESVHVGNPDLLFPPPSAVPALMAEFCREFPMLSDEEDPEKTILIAAEFSHRFVHIHPFSDGNGRVSRLLMNLIIDEFPPVYLKADKKGRGRYLQSLKRADRGNYQPLAALIAGSVVEMYEKMLRTISR